MAKQASSAAITAQHNKSLLADDEDIGRSFGLALLEATCRLVTTAAVAAHTLLPPETDKIRLVLIIQHTTLTTLVLTGWW